MDHNVDIIEAEAIVKAAQRAMTSLQVFHAFSHANFDYLFVQRSYAAAQNGEQIDIPPALSAARIAYLAAAEAAEMAAEASLYSTTIFAAASARSPDALLSRHYYEQ